MRSVKRQHKEIDGLAQVNASSLDVSNNALIRGNLTVNGSINGGGGGGGSATEAFFTATDNANQYRSNSTTFDLKSNTSNPLFRLRNNNDVTSQSTLETGRVTTGVAEVSSSLQVQGPTTAGAINATSVSSSGPITGSSGTFTGGLSSANTNTGALNATSATVTGTASAITVSATNVNTTNATIGTTNTTNLVTGTTTSTGILSSTNTTDANVASNGAIFTEGGIKSLRTIVANQGVQIPYGQPLKSDNTHTIQTKMMDASFNKAGGLTNDALYLYTPGSTSGSASPDYVLGANAQAVKLPQTTQATSTTTGALQVAGGVGIEGNLHVGGTITGGSVSYSTTSSGTFQVTNGSGTTFQVASTHQSNSPSSGSATFAGGVGIQGNLNVGGSITGGSVSYSTTSSGTFDVTNGVGTTFTVDSTEESVSTTTGAATVAGGVGVGKNLNVGGDVLLGRNETAGTRFVAIYNTSTATNAAISIVLDDAAANSAEITKLGPNNLAGPNDLIIRNLAGNMLLYGSGNAGFYVGAANTFSQLPFTVQSAQDATTLFDGSLTTAGGLSVFKTSRLGGDLVVGEGTAFNGPRIFSLSNTSTGNDAFPIMVFDTASPASTFMFMNGPNRTADGGANTFTLRNDAGSVRLQATGAVGVTISTDATRVANPLIVENTTQSTSPTTGAVQVAGGLGVAQNVTIGGNLQVNGTINGSINMFGYEEGSYDVTPRRSVTGTQGITIVSQASRFVRVGKQVCCTLDVTFNIDAQNGSGILGIQLPIPTHSGSTPLPFSSMPTFFPDMSRSTAIQSGKRYYLTTQPLSFFPDSVFIQFFDDTNYTPLSFINFRICAAASYLLTF